MYPSIKEMMTFKKLIHKTKPTTYLLYRLDKSGKSSSRVFYGPLSSLKEELIKLNLEGFNVFMLVNAAPGKTRKSDDITHVNAFFIDYDAGDWSADDLKTFLQKFLIPPHMVIETSPGCFHVYWKVTDAPLQKFKVVQQKLVAKFGSDPKVCDLPRVMRMPGTLNWKRDEPFLSKIFYKADDVEPIRYRQFTSGMFGKDVPAGTVASNPIAVSVATPYSNDNDDLTQRVIRALQKIPSDDRSVWITTGMAIKDEFGNAGFQMFKDWSSKSSKYNEQELERQWASFKAGGGIKIGTVFWLAKSFSAKPTIGDNNMPELANLLALGEHFAQVSQNQLRYCEDANQFAVCTHGKWTNSLKSAERMSINYLQNLRTAAAQINDEVLQNFIGRNQSLSSARELLRTAESAPSLKVDLAKFDADPNIIAAMRPAIPGAIQCLAVISLDKKKSRNAVPDDMAMRVAGAAYDAKADCPQWMVFLDEITQGDTDLAEFIQLAVGYTFYGHTKEQVLFILIGSGGNGKGIFARIISKILGDYAAAMQSALLKPGAINGNSPSPALMKLKSKRFWLCSEVPKGMVLDEALVKQITGGDIVSARKLYGDQTEFLPVGKLWLLVNDMPRVRHDDKGMWRRIIPIPFNAVFTGSNRDNDLEANLQEELSGILNWALEGARKYAEAGKLEQPAASKKLLSNLRRDVDTVGIWIKARCSVIEDGKLQSKVAYDDYCDTMKREKATHMPQKEFKADLVRRGYAHKNGRDHNFFVGISIKAE